MILDPSIIDVFASRIAAAKDNVVLTAEEAAKLLALYVMLTGSEMPPVMIYTGPAG